MAVLEVGQSRSSRSRLFEMIYVVLGREMQISAPGRLCELLRGVFFQGVAFFRRMDLGAQ